ncbi:MAG: ABC transporter permease [Alphaproteobacteria bacterium]|nr:ABC transporter permease [Alphaproteobacteria bacterium]
MTVTVPDQALTQLEDAPASAPVSRWRAAIETLRKSPLSVAGFVIVIAVIAIALLAPWVAPYPEDGGTGVHFARRLRPPSWDFWFGTDIVGRDVLSRIIMGSRISLSIALFVILLAVLIGVPLGVVAGYWGGWFGGSIMRVNEVFLAIPSLVFVMCVSSLLRPSLPVVIVAISLAWWTWYARLAYGEVISLKQEQFVEAAQVSGASAWRIAFGEILPNLSSVLIVKITLDIGYVILLGASLGFLGLGVQPPDPEWGIMVAEGREQLPDAWWLTAFPGLAIFLTVIGFNLLGDGLNDILGARQ